MSIIKGLANVLPLWPLSKDRHVRAAKPQEEVKKATWLAEELSGGITWLSPWNMSQSIFQ
jgi:hypothetical protein